MRYVLSCFFTLFFISICFAESCPSLTDLQTKSLHGWQALHLESGTPLSPNELNTFCLQTKVFVLAEWMQSAPEGEAHCFYAKNKQDTSMLGVFLAHGNLQPEVNTHAWKIINPSIAHCVGHLRQCQFKAAH